MLGRFLVNICWSFLSLSLLGGAEVPTYKMQTAPAKAEGDSGALEQLLEEMETFLEAHSVSSEAKGPGLAEGEVAIREQELASLCRRYPNLVVALEGEVIVGMRGTEEVARDAISKRIPKKIHAGKQGKHILEHNNFREGRSILEADAQILLDGIHSGKYKVIRKINDHKVIVDFVEEIGICYKNKKLVGPSRFGRVDFTKNDAHIFPAAPVQY